MGIEPKILTFLDEIIDDPSLFLVELKISGKSPQQKVKIVLDGDNGVPIEKCAEISRRTGAYIEEEELIENKYILEVTSPGLDQPLQLTRQYVKNIGRSLKIKLNDGDIVKGELLEVTDEKIKISSEKTEKKHKGKKAITTEDLEILFSDIDKTNILVSFK